MASPSPALAVALLVGALLVVAAPAAADPTPIDSCTNVTEQIGRAHV